MYIYVPTYTYYVLELDQTQFIMCFQKKYSCKMYSDNINKNLNIKIPQLKYS